MVALSTTEAEYIALCTAQQEATWLGRHIKVPPERPTAIKEDITKVLLPLLKILCHMLELSTFYFCEGSSE